MEGDRTAEQKVDDDYRAGAIFWRFRVALVRLCTVGGLEGWSDDRVRDLLERTSGDGGDSPLAVASRRLSGLESREVGGEDDPFGSPSDTAGA